MTQKTPEPESLSANRRDFFRKILLKSLNRAEDVGRALAQKASNVLAPSAKTPSFAGSTDSEAFTESPSEPLRWLRPPGALSEARFTSICGSCGGCEEACPAHCIVIDPNVAGGLPYIEARQSPCVVCEDLACMRACPGGALSLVNHRNEINMGLAVMNHELCLRSQEGDQQECRLCVNQCPIGETALDFDTQGRIEVRDACIGCGVCEWVCPTYPAAIVIESGR